MEIVFHLVSRILILLSVLHLRAGSIVLYLRTKCSNYNAVWLHCTTTKILSLIRSFIFSIRFPLTVVCFSFHSFSKLFRFIFVLQLFRWRSLFQCLVCIGQVILFVQVSNLFHCIQNTSLIAIRVMFVWQSSDPTKRSHYLLLSHDFIYLILRWVIVRFSLFLPFLYFSLCLWPMLSDSLKRAKNFLFTSTSNQFYIQRYLKQSKDPLQSHGFLYCHATLVWIDYSNKLCIKLTWYSTQNKEPKNKM